jgi:LPXTG-motif cell wall-anchored protein
MKRPIFIRALIAGAGAVALTLAGSATAGALTAASTPGVYASNADADTITYIDPSTNEVTVISDGDWDEPRNPSANADGTKVAVPIRHSDQVVIIDAATREYVEYGIGFDEPYATTFVGDTVYVANKNADTVSVLNLADDTVVDVTDANTDIDGPEYIIANADGTKVYVINRSSDSVSVIDVATNAVVETIQVGSEPRSAVFSLDGSKLFVANNNDETLSVITIADSTEVSVDLDPTNAYSLSPRNIDIDSSGIVWIPAQSDYLVKYTPALDMVDYVQLDVVESVSLYGITVVDGTNFAYVTNESEGDVYVLDVTTSEWVLDGSDPLFILTDENYGSSTPRGITSIGVYTAPELANTGFDASQGALIISGATALVFGGIVLTVMRRRSHV